MVVLKRKEGQRIQIGNGISVIIQRVQGTRVVLGVEAPQGVAIIRDELLKIAISGRQPPLRPQAQPTPCQT